MTWRVDRPHLHEWLASIRQRLHVILGRLHKIRGRGGPSWPALIAAIAVLAILVFLGMLFSPRPTTYTVSAITETVTIRVQDEHGVAVRLPRVRLWRPGSPQMFPDEFCCSIKLEVRNGARLSLARNRDGDLLLQINQDGTQPDGGRLTDETGDRTLPLRSGDVLRVGLSRPSPATPQKQEPSTVLLAFSGQLKIGDDVARVRRSIRGSAL